MKKQLLATTAAIALLATPMAYAQDSAGTGSNDNAVFNQDSEYTSQPQDGFFSANPDQILASRFIGASIHTAAADDAETIGDVNDVIMTPQGQAVAVIVGVGGFLGLGEKEVAVSMDQLRWRQDEDGDQTLVADFTKEQLEGAPEFDRDALTEDEQMASDQQAAEGEEQQMASDQQAAEGEEQQIASDQQAAEGEDQQLASDQQAAEGEEQQMASDEQAAEGEDQQMASDEQAAEGEDQQVASDEQAAEGEDQQMASDEQAAEGEDQQMAEENSSGENQDEMTTASTEEMETISAAEARLEATEIVGMTVNSADGEKVGEVSEILIGENGSVEAFVVDVGGFLGMNEKPVAVSFDELKFARAQGSDEWSTIQTGLTADQLENQTAFSEDAYMKNKSDLTIEAPTE